MPTQTIEVRIDEKGNVTLHVQGVKGVACTDITAAVEKLLGTTVSSEFTPEYFQQDFEGGGDGSLVFGKS